MKLLHLCSFLASNAAIFSLSAQTTDIPVFITNQTGSVWTFPQNGPFPYDPTAHSPNPVVSGLVRPLGISYSPNGRFVYFADRDVPAIYRFPSNGPFPSTPESVVTSGINSPTDIGITPDGSTGFITNRDDQRVYTFSTAGTLPRPATVAVTGLPADADTYHIAISPDGKTGYVSSASNNAIYAFSTTGPFPVAASSPIVTFSGGPVYGLSGMTFSADGSTVFVTDYGDGAIYSFPANGPFPIDLATQSPIVTGALIVGASDIQFSSDGTTVFIPDDERSVYSFPAAGPFPYSVTAADLKVTNLPVGSSLFGIATWSPWIQTASLHGNNLILANYLNANAPASVRGLFFVLQGDDLNHALESAAPTRNAFSTYASQTAQMSLSRLVNDHLGQQRWRNHKQTLPSETASIENTESLMAESDVVAMNYRSKKEQKQSARCCQKKNVGVWFGAFGEYANAKPRHQTPDFNTGSGGAVVACDYNGIYPNPIGAGVAYAHTHVHEDEDAGYANIDQGDVFIYGTFPVANWYFDAAVWGGYYHSKNARNVSFTDFFGNEAKCKTHGWQLSPHFEIGYDHWMNWLGLEPFVMADYVACWEHHARESGPTLLNFGQKGRYCSLVRGEAGLRIQEMLSYCWGTLTFMEKASYAYQKAFHTGKINAFLIGSPGSFTVTTLTAAQNMGVGEIEVLIEPINKSCYASLAFHVEAGSKYQAYQGMVQIGKDF